jgi:hypothetical protein
MAGNPRDHVQGKGFWDGGGGAHAENGQSAGRTSGYPGRRTAKHVGLRTDLEFPDRPDVNEETVPTGK